MLSHAYSDSWSPAHGGFQVWYGPIEGSYAWGNFGAYYGFVQAHKDAENDDVYSFWSNLVVEDIDEVFGGALREVLRE
jgi:hypothetical protein